MTGKLSAEQLAEIRNEYDNLYTGNPLIIALLDNIDALQAELKQRDEAGKALVEALDALKTAKGHKEYWGKTPEYEFQKKKAWELVDKALSQALPEWRVVK